MSYSNPYYTEPYVVDGTTIDYSQPLAAVAQAAPPADDNQAAPSDQAPDTFADARAAFAQQDYKTALDKVNQAIAKTPGDTVLHEFRGLVLFALGQYKEAASTIYAVLSNGPGWDWTTLTSLYTDIDQFTQQLRRLEGYCKQHPKEADARFLLAYEYLVMGSSKSALTELKEVVKLNPKDQLAAQLVTSLSAPPDDPAAPPAEPPAPQEPVTAGALAGKWTSSRPDGSSIALDLGKDSKYTWTYNHDGKTQAFQGGYTVADNLLILNTDGNPAMIGQVTQLAGNTFNFKMPGGSPDDPGLKFTK